jgi:acetyl-CoA carboxylase carboxyltransferase component
VNAVYAGKLAQMSSVQEREAFVARKRAEYLEDVDLERLASDLVVDGVVEADALRSELRLRLRYAAGRDRHVSTRRHGIPPV